MLFALAASWLSLTGVDAGAATALQSGTPVSIPMPGSSYIPNLYLDVDGSAKQLKVSIAGSGGNYDLFVRFGSPFPEQNAAANYPTVSEDLLTRYAHYASASATSNESIVVLPSSRIPLQAGRWYIVVLNHSTDSATGTLTASASTSIPLASINLDFSNPRTDTSDPTNACDDSFWTDTTAAAPVGGNPGTTLGQQRKNALAHAADQLVQQLQIPVAITVHACGAHLGGDATSAVLAHAAPLYYIFDDPQSPVNSLPKKYTWYSITSAVRLAGTSSCGLANSDCNGVDDEEIEATFNEDIGESTIVGGEAFYLGFDPDPSGHSIDFVTIAMHEMTHGLGFTGLVNLDSTQGPVGAKAGITIDASGGSITFQGFTLGPYDDIYGDDVAIVNGTSYTPFMGYEVTGAGDSARAAALTSGPTITQAGQYNPGTQTGLRWSDPVAANASGINDLYGMPAPDDFPSLYAPCDETKTTSCSTQPSSTLSHTIQSGDMMNAYYSGYNLRSMGLAVPMLAALGWSNATATMPVFGQPIPSNWFDRSHSGHGFDFQLFGHDPIYGRDVYFLTFYTYQDDGTPEWYQASGSIVDGVFLADMDPNGNTLHRFLYTTNSTSIVSLALDSSVPGSVVVDFNQASQSPACRDVDRKGALALAVMSWSIGNDSGEEWCVEPIVPIAQHATPDFNGHWFAPSDSGWGFELLDVTTSGGATSVIAYVYYPGPDGQPTWATASGNLVDNATAAMPLLQISDGFCRTCPPPAQLTAKTIGTLTLSLQSPNPGNGKPTGTASIAAAYGLPDGSGFNRTSIPISMLSVPTGQ